MKILVATDSFKGSASSIEIANTLEESFENKVDVLKVPIADGGEGMVDTLLEPIKGNKIFCDIKNSKGSTIKGFYGLSIDKKKAFIEVASAVSITYTSNEKKVEEYSSYGVGELIIDAIKNGAKEIIIGLGGSGTNDGGIGMANALGAKFYDNNNNELKPIAKNLINISHIDISPIKNIIKDIKFRIACDVDNPLTGKNGATHIFGPQKGLKDKLLIDIENGMINYKDIVKKEFNIDLDNIPGAGAAGGLGAASVLYLNGKLESGIDLVLDIVNFEDLLKDVDLVITGEGKLDNQSLAGKVPIGVAKKSSKKNITTIAIAGLIEVDKETLNKHGIKEAICINPKGEPFEVSMKNVKKNIYNTGKNIINKYLI